VRSTKAPSVARLIAFAAAAALLGSSASAGAFCRTTACGKDCDVDPETGCATGVPIVWPQFCVSYSLQYQASTSVDLDTARTLASRAFDAWQNVACPEGGLPSIQLEQHYGAVACKVHEYNQVDGNANIIMFYDDVWPYTMVTDVLALTTVTFSKRTGDVYDVDMEINGRQPLSTGEIVTPEAYDLQSILTHEAGHFLGLAHSLDPEATMWAQYSAGTDSFRDISLDDAAGICAIYPPTSQPNSCDWSPRQGFSPGCGLFPSGTGSCSVAPASLVSRPRWDAKAAWFALAAWCAVRARRRRPR
jgi:hypothetical protein